MFKDELRIMALCTIEHWGEEWMSELEFTPFWTLFRYFTSCYLYLVETTRTGTVLMQPSIRTKVYPGFEPMTSRSWHVHGNELSTPTLSHYVTGSTVPRQPNPCPTLNTKFLRDISISMCASCIMCIPRARFIWITLTRMNIMVIHY